MEKKLLVVDDEQSIRKLLEKAFTKNGYAVALAESGEQALEILEKETLQVMFIDLRLPGISGLELCRQIRVVNPIACIYAMTGYGSLFELSDCREAGFDDYFLKPIDLEIFIKTVEDSFDKIKRWTQR